MSGPTVSSDGTMLSFSVSATCATPLDSIRCSEDLHKVQINLLGNACLASTYTGTWSYLPDSVNVDVHPIIDIPTVPIGMRVLKVTGLQFSYAQLIGQPVTFNFTLHGNPGCDKW